MTLAEVLARKKATKSSDITILVTKEDIQKDSFLPFLFYFLIRRRSLAPVFRSHLKGTPPIFPASRILDSSLALVLYSYLLKSTAATTILRDTTIFIELYLTVEQQKLLRNLLKWTMKKKCPSQISIPQ